MVRCRQFPLRLWFALAFVALLLTSCSPEKAKPVGTALTIKVPLGLPQLPLPANNPPTTRTVALGRMLYYDPILSHSNTLSCASCHRPDRSFTDGRRVSVGDNKGEGLRNAMTILNAAYYDTNFWDGRVEGLEEQVGGPMANPIEMNQPHKVSVAKLNALPRYQKAFAAAFGPGPVTIEKIRMAIASFERTLLSGNSPFDRYQYGHDSTALSPAAIRGLAVFQDKKRGNCVACHTIGEQHALFTDGKFHNIGIGVNGEGELTDLGRYGVTKKEADKGAFRTPSLRDVAVTPPYMHDGSVKTLKEVVDYYVGGGNSNPHLDQEMHTLPLSGRERADLLAFLQSLTGVPAAGTEPPATTTVTTASR